MISYKSEVERILSEINSSKTELKLHLDASSRYLSPQTKENKIRDYDIVIANEICEATSKKYDSETNTFTLVCDISHIEKSICNSLKHLMHKCHPAKKPPRTKFYKGFILTVNDNKHNEDFVNDAVNILEYHRSVTETESITSKNNDVHRKNIFKLIELMERKYGAKESSN